MHEVEKEIGLEKEKQEREEKKERIIALIESEAYVPVKRKEMALLCKIPAKETTLFYELLDEAEAEGRIVTSKRGKIMSLKSAGMGIGTFLGHAKGFGFVVPDAADAEDVFISADETKGALNKDKVLYKVLKKSSGEKRAEGVIIRVLQRGSTRAVGVYESVKNFGFVSSDDKKLGRDIYIPHGASMGAVTGHKVVVEITDFGDGTRNPEGKVTEILGHINDPGVDILSVIRRYELPVEFSEDIYKEIEKIPDAVLEEEKKDRMDLRNVLTITIDGADSKDLDDAVSLRMLENGHYELGVHIADVSHYVREGTLLDEEAYDRGTSVYLVDRVIPMLPHKLSNGICSLNPHEDRLALSCIMEIDEKGKVVNHTITESVIYSDFRMTYDTVREILEDKTESLLQQYAPIVQMLENMNELRQILGEKRKKRGSVNFDLPESKIILDEQGKPIDIKPYERNIATNLIEEFMLVCNETVAEHFFWQEVPFMYRTHEEPDEEKLEKLEDFLSGMHYYVRKKDGTIRPKELQRLLVQVEGTDEERIITRVVLRSMMQARYSAENLGHFGLAAKYYCHFTSPIRRYPDLQIHRIFIMILHGQLAGKKEQKLRRDMPERAQHCSIRERTAESAERDTDEMKKVEYMEGHIGEQFEGVISGVTNWGVYVELPNTVEGMVSLAHMTDDYYVFDERKQQVYGRKHGRTFSLGDKVQVVVDKVDREMNTIDFVLAEEI